MLNHFIGIENKYKQFNYYERMYENIVAFSSFTQETDTQIDCYESNR